MSHGHAKVLREQDLRLAPNNKWRQLPLIAFSLAIVGILLALWLKYQNGLSKEFFASYLTAYMYWLSIGLGGLFFILIQYVTRAGWSITVRRIAENVAITLPLMALLSLPLLIWGTHDLYHWTHHHAVESDPILLGKSGYLNLPFFYIRAIIYFTVWCGTALYFFSQSIKQDRTHDPEITRKLTKASPLLILLWALTLTFASFDWIMSLDPHWFSTMFGVYYFAGSAVAIFAFIAFIAIGLRFSGALEEVVTAEHFQDIGKFLFGFCVFWAYIAFSQYMLYWYANIPEETAWFLHRWEGSWKSVSIVLGVGHFAIPFYFLMSRHIKRRLMTLFIGAIWMLAIHYVDLYWQIMPTVHKDNAHFSLMDLATFLAIGGLFMGIFGLALVRNPLVPAKDPRLAESLAHENY